MTDRQLLGEPLNGLDKHIKIFAVDEPSLDAPKDFGVNHGYEVRGYDKETGDHIWSQFIQFQYGPVKENGVNGLSHEALLLIVEDRLTQFQNGPHACDENKAALAFLQQSLHWHGERTRRRIAQGIEGTSQVDSSVDKTITDYDSDVSGGKPASLMAGDRVLSPEEIENNRQMTEEQAKRNEEAAIQRTKALAEQANSSGEASEIAKRFEDPDL